MAEPTSPLVKEISWGRIEVAGLGAFKDAKLWPGGGRAWDWGETGTRHVPGIQPADVDELLEQGCEVVVLTQGMHLVLQTKPETLAHLKSQNVEVVVEETKAAVERYNALAEEGARVGALIHSTC